LWRCKNQTISMPQLNENKMTNPNCQQMNWPNSGLSFAPSAGGSSAGASSASAGAASSIGAASSDAAVPLLHRHLPQQQVQVQPGLALHPRLPQRPLLHRLLQQEQLLHLRQLPLQLQ
ncbi:hypothetical protein L9F63_012550, partial [Diploptera punctata]